jgi:hypothetical protein
MLALLFVVLALNVALLGAAQFVHHGYALADQVCLGAFGLCDQPLWLAAATAIFVAAFAAQATN